MVSSTPRPHFTPGKDPVPMLQEAGWAPGPVCMVGKSRPHRDSIPDRPAHSQSLYRLSYPAHTVMCKLILKSNEEKTRMKKENYRWKIILKLYLEEKCIEGCVQH